MSKVLFFSDQLLSLNCSAKERQCISEIFFRLKAEGSWFDHQEPESHFFKFKEPICSEAFYRALFYCLEDEGFDVFGYYDNLKNEDHTNLKSKLHEFIQATCSIVGADNVCSGELEASEVRFRIEPDINEEGKIGISLSLTDQPGVQLSRTVRFAYAEKEEPIFGYGFTAAEAAADFLQQLGRIDPKELSLSIDDNEILEQDSFEHFGEIVKNYFSKLQDQVANPGICLISTSKADEKTTYNAFGISRQGVLGFFSDEKGLVEIPIAEGETPRSALSTYVSTFREHAHAGDKLMVGDKFSDFASICCKCQGI